MNETGIAILALIVSVVVAIWGIYQTRVTSQLEVQVHRLSIDLDQSIQRLYRAKELVANLQADFHLLLSMSPEINPKLQARDPDYLQVTLEKMISGGSRIDVNKSEIMALAGVINDKELISTVIQYQALRLDSPLEMDADDVGVEMQKLREISIKAFSRIYQLITIMTSDELDVRHARHR